MIGLCLARPSRPAQTDVKHCARQANRSPPYAEPRGTRLRSGQASCAGSEERQERTLATYRSADLGPFTLPVSAFDPKRPFTKGDRNLLGCGSTDR